MSHHVKRNPNRAVPREQSGQVWQSKHVDFTPTRPAKSTAPAGTVAFKHTVLGGKLDSSLSEIMFRYHRDGLLWKALRDFNNTYNPGAISGSDTIHKGAELLIPTAEWVAAWKAMPENQGRVGFRTDQDTFVPSLEKPAVVPGAEPPPASQAGTVVPEGAGKQPAPAVAAPAEPNVGAPAAETPVVEKAEGEKPAVVDAGKNPEPGAPAVVEAGQPKPAVAGPDAVGTTPVADVSANLKAELAQLQKDKPALYEQLVKFVLEPSDEAFAKLPEELGKLALGLYDELSRRVTAGEDVEKLFVEFGLKVPTAVPEKPAAPEQPATTDGAGGKPVVGEVSPQVVEPKLQPGTGDAGAAVVTADGKSQPGGVGDLQFNVAKVPEGTPTVGPSTEALAKYEKVLGELGTVLDRLVQQAPDAIAALRTYVDQSQGKGEAERVALREALTPKVREYAKVLDGLLARVEAALEKYGSAPATPSGSSEPEKNKKVELLARAVGMVRERLGKVTGSDAGSPSILKERTEAIGLVRSLRQLPVLNAVLARLGLTPTQPPAAGSVSWNARSPESQARHDLLEWVGLADAEKLSALRAAVAEAVAAGSSPAPAEVLEKKAAVVPGS